MIYLFVNKNLNNLISYFLFEFRLIHTHNLNFYLYYIDLMTNENIYFNLISKFL